VIEIPATPPIKATRERQREELRQTILTEAATLIREHGRDALTMRKLAARLGCTPMAIYSYFPDKQALERALAWDQFSVFAARTAKALKGKQGVAAIRAGLIAYVAAARENPEQYQTLFMTPIPPDTPQPTREQLEQQHPAFRPLYEQTAAAIELGELQGDPFALATILWTAAHGAAASIITFTKFPITSWETFAAAMIDTAIAGIRQNPIANI
jgi:AcrR family transcriptional regulator